MSFKNRLQEFYQKRKETLPVYKTERVSDTPAHAPLWVSTVVLHDGRQFTGSPDSKKSAAELNAAEMAFEMKPVDLTKVLDAEIKDLTMNDIAERVLNNANRIILVDVENIPQALDISMDRISDNTQIVGVIGHCHSKAHVPFPFMKYTIRSAMADAADHALSVLAGYLSAVFANEIILDDRLPTIIVLSRDHYAETTVKCLQSEGFRAVHITTVKEMEKYL